MRNGFLIVDQTPAKLLPDVMKNTNVKIMHRLTARDDRDAMGMNEAQPRVPPHFRRTYFPAFR